jgi:cytochrome c oxidase subunit 2
MTPTKVILTAAISIIALGIQAALQAATGTKTIDINESRFAFEPNEITLTKNQEVTLLLHSKDVTHGLIVEGLGLRANEVKKGGAISITFVPDKVGTFEGKCSHFCGSGHGSMLMVIHVIEPTGTAQ